MFTMYSTVARTDALVHHPNQRHVIARNSASEENRKTAGYCIRCWATWATWANCYDDTRSKSHEASSSLTRHTHTHRAKSMAKDQRPLAGALLAEASVSSVIHGSSLRVGRYLPRWSSRRIGACPGPDVQMSCFAPVVGMERGPHLRKEVHIDTVWIPCLFCGVP